MNNSDKFLDKLFTSAKSQRVDTTRSEFAFETRLMARIRALGENQSASTNFLAIAWRVIPFFCLIVILLGVWSYTVPAAEVPTDLYALAGNEMNGDWLIQYLPWI
jgi:hypothetical protein